MAYQITPSLLSQRPKTLWRIVKWCYRSRFNQLLCSKVFKVKSNDLQVHIERSRRMIGCYVSEFSLCQEQKNFGFYFSKNDVMRRFLVTLYFLFQCCVLGSQLLVLRIKVFLL